MTLRSLSLLALLVLSALGAGLAAARWLAQPAPVVVDVSGSPIADGQIRVYVSGAVRRPGVYPLKAGDRVVEAVQAAGGPTDDADTETVNFAARIHDEEHLHVPRLGEAEASTVEALPTATQKVDLNRAGIGLLRSLPGIGQTRAANIVASRERDGFFQRPEDLVQRKLLTPALYDRVKDLVETVP